MKKVTAIVDMDDFSPKMIARTHAFQALCVLLMQLRVFDSLTLKCNKGSSKVRTWTADHNNKRFIITKK